MSALRIALCAFAALLGWLATALLGGAFFPPPYLPVLSEKRAYFSAHAEEFDAVFIGSSRVYRGVIPAVFDTEIAARGEPMRSFNFGMEAMWPPESFYRVREFLRRRPKVRWLFIELLPVNPHLTGENARTLRAIYWHDWRSTLLACREIFARRDFTAAERASHFALHGELFFRRISQLARGATLLEPLLRPDMEKAARKLAALNSTWESDDGFLAEPDTPMSSAAAENFRQRVDVVRGASRLPLPGYLRAEIAELVQEVREAGAVPIFFITPSVTPAEDFADLREQGIDADLISFKDPARYPALYDPALHFDGPHLNEQGARELSRELAAEVAALLGSPR